MDFHGMKRKELQTLCKKHGVPGNLTNREMADRLASIFRENEEVSSSNSEEIGGEIEAKVVKKQAKKVRFNPENQTFEYVVSVYRPPTRRSRKKLLSKNASLAIENTATREDVRKVESSQVRVTRSRMQQAVEDDVNISPSVGRKRRRGMKNRDTEVNDTGKSEVLDVTVNGGLSGRQLRSKKNVTQEESKIRKGKGSDEVHLLDQISEESNVGCRDSKSKNGRKQPTRNARKENQSVKLSSIVEKVEAVSTVTGQSRLQPENISSMETSEVKTVGVQGIGEEVLPLKEPRKKALGQNAESSLIAAAEKPLRRSERNAEKNCARSAPSMTSETKVRKVQELSERDVAHEDPPECLRQYSSRRKSVVAQRENNEESLKTETNKRSRITGLDAVVEHSDEIERAKCAFILQDQPPLRRSRRRTVILNAPALTYVELKNKEHTDKMKQLRAPYLGKDMTEELPRNSSQIVVADKGEGVKPQMQQPSPEEEKTSLAEHHPATEKPQRRSNRITSRRASVATHNPAGKVIEKRQPSKSRMKIIEEETALIQSLPATGELPAGKEDLALAEGSGNKNDLDLNFSEQAVKNADRCSSKKRKGLRRDSGAKKQCGFLEASPRFLDMEKCKDSSGNMEETVIRTSEKLVGSSADQEMQQSAQKSIVVEKENNSLGDDTERLVHGGNVESEQNCVSNDGPNCSDPKLLEFEGSVSPMVGSPEINFLAESQGPGTSDQEMNENMEPIGTHSSNEYLVVYKKDRSLVENDKQRLVQVDSTDNEMKHPQSSWSINGRGARNDSNVIESRKVEFESHVINMESFELSFLSNGLSLTDQRDLTDATSILLNSEKELETEPPRGENTKFFSDNVNADDSRTPFGETHILVELKDTDVIAVESVSEAILKDSLDEFGETSDLQSGSKNTLKKAEEMIATNFSYRDGVPHVESSVKATENIKNSVEFHFATVETGTQKIIEIQHSSYGNPPSPETPCGRAPGNQSKDNKFRVEAADTAKWVMSDQERSKDVNSGNADFIHESKGEMKYQSCLSLNIPDSIDDFNLVEHGRVDFESNGSKIVSPEKTSVVNAFSSASQADLAGKTSSHMEPEKVLETGESSQNMNSINYSLDTEGSKTPIEDVQTKVQLKDANLTAADSIGEVIFNDLLNELGESIGLKKGSEIPLKKSEKLCATEFSDGEGIAFAESSIKATEKLEHGAHIDTITAITATPNITEMKWSSGSGTATSKAPFGSATQCKEIPSKKSEKLSANEFSDGERLAFAESSIKAAEKHEYGAHIDTVTAITGTPIITEMKRSSSNGTATIKSLFRFETQCKDKSCSTGITLNITGSEICNQDNETSLVEGDKETLIQYDTIEGEIKYQLCSSLNQKGALDDALVEPRMVEFESNAKKVTCSGMTSLADICSSASQANVAGETSNELKPEKVLESEESPSSENVYYGSYKIEVEEPTQEDQNPMHLEDANMIFAESIQEVVSWNHLNELFESYYTKEFEFSLKKAEETCIDNSSGKGLIQTESSVDINEKSEATAKIHSLSAEAGEKTTMEMQWSISSHDTTLISPLSPIVGGQDVQGTIYRVETSVSNTGYGMCGHQKNEENVKVVENEHDRTINTEKNLFFSGKIIHAESFEGKILVDGFVHRLSDGTDSQCAKDKKVDISEGSFDDVSHEAEEKHIWEVLNEEGTNPVKSKEKGNHVSESASHADFSPQSICNEKLSFNSCLPVSNDMQETFETVCTDNESMGNEIQAYFFPQFDLEQLNNENESAKQGAENVEANASDISTAIQALPSEELTASIISEHFSVRPHDLVLVDGERNPGEERVMNHPLNKDFDATMDSNGISAVRETDVGQDDIMEDIAISSLKVVVDDHSGCKVVSSEISGELPNESEGTMLGDLDDQGEEVVALQRDSSSSIGVDGPRSAVGIIVDNISKVGILESPLNGNDPHSGTKVDDLVVNDTANEFHAALTVEDAVFKDGGETPALHQISLHGGMQEYVPSVADKPCGKPEIEKEELHPQVMEDINDVGRTEVSIDCKVAKEKRDGYQMNTGGFGDVTDGYLEERSKEDVEEKAYDYEGSVKRATFTDSTNSLVTKQPLRLDESKSCEVETKEVDDLHLQNKLDIVSSVKPTMVINFSPVSDEHKELEMSLFEVKRADANAAGDSNHSTIPECNSSIGSDNEETMELKKDLSDKTPLLKKSEVGRVEACRSELNLLSGGKIKERSNCVSASVKQLSCKSKFSLIQRTPKSLIIKDMKENHPSTKQIGPKTSSKTKRLPLEPVWKY